jgi:hypothetical protein
MPGRWSSCTAGRCGGSSGPLPCWACSSSGRRLKRMRWTAPFRPGSNTCERSPGASDGTRTTQGVFHVQSALPCTSMAHLRLWAVLFVGLAACSADTDDDLTGVSNGAGGKGDAGAAGSSNGGTSSGAGGQGTGGCTPGQTERCYCKGNFPGELPSQRRCNAEGTGYGVCEDCPNGTIPGSGGAAGAGAGGAPPAGAGGAGEGGGGGGPAGAGGGGTFWWCLEAGSQAGSGPSSCSCSPGTVPPTPPYTPDCPTLPAGCCYRYKSLTTVSGSCICYANVPADFCATTAKNLNEQVIDGKKQFEASVTSSCP